jgi:hypothetical protein
MTDAPLFILSPHHGVNDRSITHVENVIPQRKQADHLINLYWENIHPIEPFIDREHFTRLYQSIFAGDSLALTNAFLLVV